MRTANLLRQLAHRHEVRQFSQARSRRAGDPESSHGALRVTPSYTEFRARPRLATLATELSARSWVRAPVLSGTGLHRSRQLRELIDWGDVVLVEFPWQVAACRRLRPTAPLVLAGHNVEAPKFADYARAAGSPRTANVWLRAIERIERRAVRSADLVLAVSDADRADLIARYGAAPDRVTTVPNGADTARYRPVTATERRAARAALGLPDRPTVLFAAADVPPNRAGLDWVRRVAARAPQVTFLVTGTVAPPGRDDFVAVGLLDDFGQALAAADCALCPIEFGGGTKIKLLEGLAAGLPTVAFAEALHGLDLTDEVLVAPKSGDGLVAAVERALHPAVGADLSARGRAWVIAHHSWQTIAAQLEERLLALAGQAAAVGAGAGSSSTTGSGSMPTTSYTSS